MDWSFASCLQLLALLTLLPCSMPLRLLLLGDSLDRHISQEWCTYQRNQLKRMPDEYNWGEGAMRYAPKGSSRIPAWICTSDTDGIAFTHIYGSNATGPYFHQYRNSPTDPEVDSELRLNKSIASYVHQFGLLPDRVIFSTMHWDAQLAYEKNSMDAPVRFTELWNISVLTFEVICAIHHMRSPRKFHSRSECMTIYSTLTSPLFAAEPERAPRPNYHSTQ